MNDAADWTATSLARLLPWNGYSYIYLTR